MSANLDSKALQSSIVSPLAALGIFQNVTGHEPKSAPSNALNAAVFLTGIAPIRAGGLASTSARIEFTIRIYNPMIQEPQDDIDPAILDAAADVIAVYSANLELDVPNLRCIDVLGMYGTGLQAVAGYFNQDSRIYRAMAVTLPLILNDVFDQEN